MVALRVGAMSFAPLEPLELIDKLKKRVQIIQMRFLLSANRFIAQVDFSFESLNVFKFIPCRESGKRSQISRPLISD